MQYDDLRRGVRNGKQATSAVLELQELLFAQTIAKHVLPLGHQITLSNSRSPDSLAELVKELGPGAIAGTPQEATEQDLVVLAVN
jgi:hypothetical protein